MVQVIEEFTFSILTLKKYRETKYCNINSSKTKDNHQYVREVWLNLKWN